jgi:hypothetical protein
LDDGWQSGNQKWKTNSSHHHRGYHPMETNLFLVVTTAILGEYPGVSVIRDLCQ